MRDRLFHICFSITVIQQICFGFLFLFFGFFWAVGDNVTVTQLFTTKKSMLLSVKE